MSSPTLGDGSLFGATLGYTGNTEGDPMEGALRDFGIEGDRLEETAEGSENGVRFGISVNVSVEGEAFGKLEGKKVEGAIELGMPVEGSFVGYTVEGDAVEGLAEGAVLGNKVMELELVGKPLET